VTEQFAVSLSERRTAEYVARVNEHTLTIVDARRRTSIARGRGMLVSRALAIADVTALLAAFLLAQAFFGAGDAAVDWVDGRLEFALFAVTLPVWIVVARIYGLYDRDERRTDHSTVDELTDVFHMVTVGVWLFFALSWAAGVADPYLPKLIVFWAFAIGFVTTARAGARAMCRRNAAYVQNAVIVGAGDVGQLVASKLRRHPEYGVNVIGFVDREPKDRPDELKDLMILGDHASLPELIRLFDIERVIVAFSRDSYIDTLRLIRSMKHLDVRVDIVPRFFEAIGATVSMHSVEGIPVMELPPVNLSRSSLLIKRIIDIALSIIGLMLVAPILAVVAVLIRIDSEGPALYRDERIGRDGRRFRSLKFRTLRAEHSRGLQVSGESADRALDDLLAADSVLRREFEVTHKLREDPRLTRIGPLLRRLSLDELPQLLNVLLGDISLVGPRAITAYEYSRLRNQQIDAEIAGYWDIANLRPGLTGYWQINGRSAVTYGERLRLDMAYVSSWSLGLDLTILAKTARALVARSGAY
jgi:exopolysaccharide biosynthesis polyprenyl glycosylphosphotransferase